MRSIKAVDELSFNLDGGEDGVYLLRTSSQADMACWMKEIGDYIEARAAYERAQAIAASR